MVRCVLDKLTPAAPMLLMEPEAREERKKKIKGQADVEGLSAFSLCSFRFAKPCFPYTKRKRGSVLVVLKLDESG